MAGFGPDLCLLIILIFRLIQFFGAVMASKWFMAESSQNREHLANGLLVYAVCQIICALATLIALVAWSSISGWLNIGVLGVGFVLITFVYEIYCFYVWLKARQYCDLAEAAEKQGVNLEDIRPQFELN